MVIVLNLPDDESEVATLIDTLAESDDEHLRAEAARLEQSHFGVEPQLQPIE
jgi:hypothetical protein